MEEPSGAACSKVIDGLLSGLIQAEAETMDAIVDGNGAGASVPLWRLYILRLCYAILAAGLGSIQIPAFLHHPHWTQASAVAHSFFLALALLALVGIRYPLLMLPLLVFELLWKMIWLGGVALPLWVANQVDADTHKAFFQIAPVIILIPLLPWRYIVSVYVRKSGDRWR